MRKSKTRIYIRFQKSIRRVGIVTPALRSNFLTFFVSEAYFCKAVGRLSSRTKGLAGIGRWELAHERPIDDKH